MRKSTPYLALTAIGALLLVALIGFYPVRAKSDTDARLERERAMVNQFQLTDIALFTEASYTRHPNLADRFVPFQDHPMAISHFPSESLLAPPAHLLADRVGADQEVER
jgi:hypothetical protein